jgi:hypothetical protein
MTGHDDDGPTRPALTTSPFIPPKPAANAGGFGPDERCRTCGQRLHPSRVALEKEKDTGAIGAFLIIALVGLFLGVAVGAFAGSFRYGLGVFALACMIGVAVAVGVQNSRSPWTAEP